MADILFVNSHDQPIGKGSTQEAIENGYIFRVARVMLTDRYNRFLLQKRADHLALFPGRWDNSAAGKVDEGESYVQAAVRELEEELGITGITLTAVSSYYSEIIYGGKKHKRFNKVFEARYNDDPPKNFNTGEVSMTQWFGAKELVAFIQASPETFTDGVIDYFTKIRPLMP